MWIGWQRKANILWRIEILSCQVMVTEYSMTLPVLVNVPSGHRNGSYTLLIRSHRTGTWKVLDTEFEGEICSYNLLLTPLAAFTASGVHILTSTNFSIRNFINKNDHLMSASGLVSIEASGSESPTRYQLTCLSNVHFHRSYQVRISDLYHHATILLSSNPCCITHSLI
jgi:hypothetical protein